MFIQIKTGTHTTSNHQSTIYFFNHLRNILCRSTNFFDVHSLFKKFLLLTQKNLIKKVQFYFLTIQLTSLKDKIRQHAAFLFILFCFFVGTGYLSSIRPLWFDELFTFYIAGTGSLSNIMELLGPMDPHPPVQYILVSLSLKCFGYSELATRIPSITMIGVFMTCTYAIVLRFLDKKSALFAVLLILLSVGFKYGYEARPYAIVLGFVSLSYWSWLLARESKKITFVLLTGVFCAATVLTHFYAILALFPLYLFQLWSTFKREKGGLLLLISMGLGSAMIFTMVPILKSITVLSKNNWAAPSLYDFLAAGLHFYWFLALLSLVFLWHAKASWEKLKTFLKSRKNYTVLLLLASLMLYGFLISLITGAFHNRYVISTLLGSVCTAALFFHVFNGKQKILSLLLVVVTGFALYAFSSIRAPFHEREMLSKKIDAFNRSEQVPIVFSHYLDYLIYYHYGDEELKKRLVYLIDYSLDFDYPMISGDISLHMLKKIKPDLNLEDYQTFLDQNTNFLVYGNQAFSYELQDLYNNYDVEEFKTDDIIFKKLKTSSELE